MEWEAAQQDPPENPLEDAAPPVSRRHSTKRAASPGGTAASHRNARARANAGQELAAEAWWSQVEFPEAQEEAVAYWTHPESAIEIAINMPTSKRGIQLITEDLESYVVTAIRRRAVELSEKKMDPQTKAEFAGAKAAEVKNFIAAKAFESLPPHLQPPRSQAIGMRWILTWKLKDDGSVKPTARAILLGYQDPGYEHRATTTPVMTKQSRQMVLQVSARRRWKMRKGDVSGAFLQGRVYPTDLCCIPCPEICKAMGTPEESITKVKRGCYALVDAPLEWYRTISQTLARLGLEKSWTDPCLWLWRPQGELRGIISCHVDDFLFTGAKDDKEWNNILKKIQEEYAWGEWESEKFVQCGVLIEEQPDNSYHLSQPNYMDKAKEIPVSASRRREQLSAGTPSTTVLSGSRTVVVRTGTRHSGHPVENQQIGLCSKKPQGP